MRMVTIKEAEQLEQDIKYHLSGIYNTHVNPAKDEIDIKEFADNLSWVIGCINREIHNFLIGDK